MEHLLNTLVGSAGTVIATAGSASTVEGEWTPGTVVGHLADVDNQVWLPRLRLMIDAHRAGAAIPSFVWWEPDAVETARRYESLPLSDCAVTFMQSRAALVDYLRGLDASDWAATALHSTMGEMTVQALLERVLEHDIEHGQSL